MTEQHTPASDPALERDRRLLREARNRGPLGRLTTYARLSGPGWLQSAITLGGGSLGGSLFLGAIAGFSIMWVQPLAMLMGVIMLSAIAYVTLSTGKRPFQAIAEHVNPVLAWSWIIATMMANMVWCMPQFGLATAALQENLGVPAGPTGQITATVVLALLALGIVWLYRRGNRGVWVFEIIVKLMIALIVLSFLGVVVAMTIFGQLNWPAIFAGFVPDTRLLSRPAESLMPAVEATGTAAIYWSDYIVAGQRDRMISVAATAVGINMTFLLPYSMLARRWDRDFRGLGIFDLATGLFIPFIFVTTFIVIAAAAQLHNEPAPGLLGEEDQATGRIVQPDTGMQNRFNRLLNRRILWEIESTDQARAARLNEDTDEARAELEALRDALPEADRYIAAVVIDRDAWDLARALQPLTGPIVAQYVFGIGVLGVALSTIIILMLINGFVFTEMANRPGSRWLHRAGALVVVLIGAVGSLTLWREEARYFLVVPTSVFGMMLAPIAYITFFCLMNNRKLLGDQMPTGLRRVWWNGIMLAALGFVIPAAGWAIWTRTAPFPGTDIPTRFVALGVIGVLIMLGLILHLRKPRTTEKTP